MPGQPQYKYAKKLGFNENKIISGLYCANENYSEQLNNQNLINNFYLLVD